MPPVRAKDAQPEASTSHVSHKKAKKSHGPKYQPKESAIPGVSKLKSSIRQTRRLLAKESLAPNVRVETERRLKSLEADLAKAEVSKKERALAVKYHRIKFFDRQKLLRRIKQTMAELEDPDTPSNSKKVLIFALYQLRVDLNYVLNYPKLEKYISLFPPDIRKGDDGHVDPVQPPSSAQGLSATDAKREEVREWVRTRMMRGELSARPETLERVETDAGHGESAAAWRGATDDANVGKSSKKRKAVVAKVPAAGLEHDGFFEGADGGQQEDEDVAEDVQVVPKREKRKKSSKTDEPVSMPERKSKKKSRRTQDEAQEVDDDFFE
ncbi:hypothetical protein FA95DRAFT_1571765 [Auriscalpium vulgare]|uniref:Uncharacterized protein n=1 Tax=Auriscalpium vulgare TaxID=40419 RepID=A0ACB8RYB3_9AGAM|nr:hypothetical protein FA95DRAFT_1571765 [Auriscalpium vulgare]